MKIVYLGDHLHEIPTPMVLENKYFKMSSAEFFSSMLSVRVLSRLLCWTKIGGKGNKR